MEVSKDYGGGTKNDSLLFVAFEPPRCIKKARKITEGHDNTKTGAEVKSYTKTRTKSLPTSRAQFRPIQVPKRERTATIEASKVSMDDVYEQISGSGRGAWRKPIPTKPKIKEVQEENRHVREQQLELEVASLTSQVTRLEKVVTGLNAENELLKRKVEEHKVSEEKVKKLKKRNAELAAIARRLEEKTKQLQQENSKRNKEKSPSDVEHLKRTFARQRAKDIADHTKDVLEKDTRIEKLKKKCQDLADQISNNNTQILNGEVYEDKEELENILKQAAKERLKLQKQISGTEVSPGASQIDYEKLQALQDTNAILQSEVHRLSEQATKADRLETEVNQKRIECESLYKEVNDTRKKCSELEIELQESAGENAELHKRLQELDKVNEECKLLKTSLAVVETEYHTAKNEISSLQDKISQLENSLQLMKEEVSDKKKLQNEHREAVEKLKEKEKTVNMLNTTREETQKEHEIALSGLQVKLRELERKYEQQAIKHHELTKEMGQLRQDAEKAKQRPKTSNIEIQTETETSAPYQPPHSTPHIHRMQPDINLIQQAQQADENLRRAQPSVEMVQRAQQADDAIRRAQQANHAIRRTQQANLSLDSSMQYRDSNKNDSSSMSAASTMSAQEPQITSDHREESPDIIQEFYQRQEINNNYCEQENITHNSESELDLEFDLDSLNVEQDEVSDEVEIEKDMAHWGLDTMSTETLNSLVPEGLMTMQPDLPHNFTLLQAQNYPETNNDTENDEPLYNYPQEHLPANQDVMGDGYHGNYLQDQPVLTKESASYINYYHGNNPQEQTANEEEPNVECYHGDEDQHGDDIVFKNQGWVEGALNQSGLSLPQEHEFGEDSELVDIANKIKALSMSDSESDVREDVPSIPDSMGSRSPQVARKVAESGAGLNFSTSYSSKTNFQVFVAKYNYDPLIYSPNENPEAELTLNAGDYVIVYGGMDEDGFFDGELKDGRRGLIPSNFVEKLQEEELDEFYANMVAGQRSENESQGQSELDFNSGDELDKFGNNVKAEPNQALELADLDDITEVNESNLSSASLSDPSTVVIVTEIDLRHKGVQHPENLRVERQLKNSLMIGWDPPCNSQSAEIDSYAVYADGQLKTSVKSSERTKALLEGLDTNQPIRLSVRTVTAKGQSKDQQCTLVIGKEASLAPTELRVTNITDDGAILSWLPSNSSCSHVVAVNRRGVKVVQPGIFKCSLAGLRPDLTHKITVKAKVGKDAKVGSEVKVNSDPVEFRTLKRSLPEAPIAIEVEPGPKEGMLLVTWIPVTINNHGTSNGAKVLGYSVYIDNKKIIDLDNPTGDHVLLEASNFQNLVNPRNVCVRTRAPGVESADSDPFKLTRPLLEEIVHSQLLSSVSIPKIPAQQVIPSQPSPRKKEPPIKKSEPKPRKAEPVQVLVTEEPDHVQSGVRPEAEPGAANPDPPKASEGLAQLAKPLTFEDLDESSQSELSDIVEEEEDDVGSSEHSKSGSRHSARSQHSAEKRRSNATGQPSPRGVTKGGGNSRPSSHNNSSPKVSSSITPKMVEGSPMLAETGFMPITDPRVPVGQAQPLQTSPHAPTTVMTVPQIEITKDSSGSLTSINDNNTDDDIPSTTSGAPSSKPSPMSPMSHDFYSADTERNAQNGANLRDDIDQMDYKQYGDSYRNNTGRRKWEFDWDLNQDYVENGHSDKYGSVKSGRAHNDVWSYSDLPNNLEENTPRTTTRHRTKSERSERSSERGRRSPDRGERGVERGRQSPEITEHSIERRRRSHSADRGRRSPDSGKRSPDRGRRSPDRGSRSPDRGRRSPDRGRRSPDRGRRSPDRGRRSPDRERERSHHSPDRYSDKQRRGSHGSSRSRSPDGRRDRSRDKSPSRHRHRSRGHSRSPDRHSDIDRQPSRRKHHTHSPDRHTPHSTTSEPRSPRYLSDRDDSLSELVDNNAISRRKIRDDIPDSELIDFEDDGGESLVDSISEIHEDDRIRIFIGLYDYDPMSMSPNMDCVDEELAFKEGQLIKVFGDKDTDGFYQGETNGQRGSIPSNMVSEVHVEDSYTAQRLLEECSKLVVIQTPPPRDYGKENGVLSSGYSTGKSSSRSPSRESSHTRPMSAGKRKMVALYDYNPSELSPNVDSELELTFRTGDILTISGDMDDDGFFMGDLNNHRGLVPSNFLKELPPDQQYDVKLTSNTSKSGDSMSGSRKSLSSSTNSLQDKRDQVSSRLPTWAASEFPNLDVRDIPEWARNELPPGAVNVAIVEVRERLRVKESQEKTEKSKQTRPKAAKSRKA